MDAHAVIASTMLQFLSTMENNTIQGYIDTAGQPGHHVVFMCDTVARMGNVISYQGPALAFPADVNAEHYAGKTRMYFALFNAIRCFRGYLYVEDRAQPVRLGVSTVEMLHGTELAEARAWWAAIVAAGARGQ